VERAGLVPLGRADGDAHPADDGRLVDEPGQHHLVRGRAQLGRDLAQDSQPATSLPKTTEDIRCLTQ